MTIEATDNAAMMAGYTRPVYIEGDCSGFSALIEPDVDLDDRFKCFDTDNQEWVWVSGWLIASIDDLECEA